MAFPLPTPLLSGSLIALALVAAVPLGAQGFVNFETMGVQPIRLSPSGNLLACAHPADNRLLVYTLARPDRPVLLKEIQVGMEPVSVHPRTEDEIWVVNKVGDSISVVSLAEGRVMKTIEVGDEPADVVFAGKPLRAFVSVAGENEVQVFDVLSHKRLARIQVFGRAPKALATSADQKRVYVAAFLSGNHTTILSADKAPKPPKPGNPKLGPAPQTGLIVLDSDPKYSKILGAPLADEDVFEIDVQTLKVLRNFGGIGTSLFAMARRPGSEDLWVANTEARNLIRFEPVLRGHAVDNRVTRLTPTGSKLQVHDLNAGIDYKILPNPKARATALSQPTGLAFSPDGKRLYVAAFGTDRIGVVDPVTGKVVARMEVGVSRATEVASRKKRGPRALAHHRSAPYLYAFNRLSNSITVLDTRKQAKVGEFFFPHDPTPTWMREARGFLYDARLSGNGTFSCASCHLSGETDGLAWDLGNPGGKMASVKDPTNNKVYPLHPMKGPMTTQTIRGLAKSAPFHWRGDNARLQDFNGAFDGLMGGPMIASKDMDDFARYMTEIVYPPNPNRNKDGSLPTTPIGESAKDGEFFFKNTPFLGGTNKLKCIDCHTLATGSNGFILNLPPEPTKTAQLRNIYKKVFKTPVGGKRMQGFGAFHDGDSDDIVDFLGKSVFGALSKDLKKRRMLQRFVLAFDTGMAPAVGMAQSLDKSNLKDPTVRGTMSLLLGEAFRGRIDLIGKGVYRGEPMGFLYLPKSTSFQPYTKRLKPIPLNTLDKEIQAGLAAITFHAVPPGQGMRLGLDRDLDGIGDGDEGALGYGKASPQCSVTLDLLANSEPKVPNPEFAVITRVQKAAMPGLLLVGPKKAFWTVLGLDIHLDLLGGAVYPISSDASGYAAAHLPIPSLTTLIGSSAWFQTVFASPCLPYKLSASPGLELTFRK